MIGFVVEDGGGLADATSYVSVEEADDIASLNIHNSDAWLALPLDSKRNLLMYSSRVLDSRTSWNGSQASPLQALAWPRTGAVDRHGNSVSPASVPRAVRWAVVEMAKHTMAEDLLSKSTPDQVVSEIKVEGAVSLKFAGAADAAAKKFRTPEIVSDILRGLGTVRNGAAKVTFGKAVRA